MDAKDFAHELRDLVADLRIQGVEAVRSENLIKYLDEALPEMAEPPPTSSARDDLYRAELQKWIEEHKHYHAESIELFKSVIQAGQNALRSAFLMNGGASVALLAFIGHLASIELSEKVSELAPSLATFVFGVLAAGLASAVTYLSQWFYAGRPALRRTAFALNVAAIVVGLGAYGAFAYGVCRAYRVFADF
jgi:hypothetical protein